ncbi:MAG: peptidoglycan DD-metalloendopeptidase family protein [Candidatus Peribacteraceae bacterium]|nr:peptidoglycan DD-metalloendopeptidase family protein [Candidatus Peribacteraceae bacterium]MDD5742384.1 peptidoglycan DD-metalloendopeptidase family protein [Candidatus Peribacteraceae bacterium]
MDTKTNPSTSLRASRIIVATVLLVGCIPLFTFALVFSDEKMDAERAFRTAIDEASAEYGRTRSLPALRRRYEAELKQAQARLPALMKDKRASRLQIAQLQHSIAQLQQRFGWQAATETPASAIQSKDIADAFRSAERMQSVLGTDPLGRSFFRRVLVASFGDVLEEDLQAGLKHSILLARVEVTRQEQRLAALEAQHETLRIEALQLTEQEERASRGLKATDEQMKNIQTTVAEVHEQVLKMQGALARIDAKIRARIERELIEKGLLTPGTIDRSAIPAAPQFAWPAYGPLSAGFLDVSYQEHFGIPHYGLDIVIGQGSPVFSAADGVVFLARDGGPSGYSYVLVGHRGGSATLYGHLSKISVTSGQDLRQGELIGLSGGAIGAHGSGPTTTGPHLHFEVIKDGTNVNPQSVLP